MHADLLVFCRISIQKIVTQSDLIYNQIVSKGDNFSLNVTKLDTGLIISVHE